MISRLIQFATWILRIIKRLGWFYALGLGVAGLALLGFTKLTDEVLEPSDLQTVDTVILKLLHAFQAPWLDSLATSLSTLGDIQGTAIIGSLILISFLLKRRYLDSVALLPVLAGAVVLVVALKHLFQLPRPSLPESMPEPLAYSYPSGHSLVSVCLYGYLAALLVLDNPKEVWRWAVAMLLGLVPLGIIWSRLYLGVHWFSDVVAGVFVAVFWLVLCLLLKHKYLHS